MCGICGFVTNRKVTLHDLEEMNHTMTHRGPDDHGEEIYQVNSDVCVGLAQRRLSIIDLSVRGHQPMHSPDSRVSIVFNGEIYNFQELREELSQSYSFQSTCDTEVLIVSYLKWGLQFVDHINGMYAMAIYDRELQSVILIRDRIGKKPLYYYVDDSSVVFGSELKALYQYPYFKKNIDRDVIESYLYRLYINGPNSIYENVYKVQPGQLIVISQRGIEKQKYWDIAEKNIEYRANPIKDYEQAKYEVERVLQEAVSRRLIADVPVGAFLSGGYDSSLICALAQSKLDRPLKTYSIGFYEEKYDEAPYAKEIAKYLGTEHVQQYVSEEDMFEVLSSIPKYYDEPFADSSQIPTMLVSKLAKQDVKVVLSGDGGDEVFGGYNIYTILQRAQKLREENEANGGLLKGETEWLSQPMEYRIVADYLNEDTKTQTGSPGYRESIKQILLQSKNNFYYDFEKKYQEERYDITRMLLDLDTFFPDDILTKVDRASMKYSLECRCPIVDKNVVEMAFRLPWYFKDDQGNQKRILKDIAYQYIPKELLDRPKMGFSIPLDQWMRGRLKEQILDYSSRDFLVKQGIFDADRITELLQYYFTYGDGGKWSGKNYSKIVWPYFIFQQWYAEYMQ